MKGTEVEKERFVFKHYRFLVYPSKNKKGKIQIVLAQLETSKPLDQISKELKVAKASLETSKANLEAGKKLKKTMKDYAGETFSDNSTFATAYGVFISNSSV